MQYARWGLWNSLSLSELDFQVAVIQPMMGIVDMYANSHCMHKRKEEEMKETSRWHDAHTFINTRLLGSNLQPVP